MSSGSRSRSGSKSPDVAGPSVPVTAPSRSRTASDILASKAVGAPLPSQVFRFPSGINAYMKRLRKTFKLEQVENMMNATIKGSKKTEIIEQMNNLGIPVTNDMTVDQLKIRKKAWPVFLSYLLKENTEVNDQIRKDIHNKPRTNYLETKYGNDLTIDNILSVLKNILYNDHPAIHRLKPAEFLKQVQANYNIIHATLQRKDYLNIVDMIIISEKEREAIGIVYNLSQQVPVDVSRQYMGLENLEPSSIRKAQASLAVFDAKRTTGPTRYSIKYDAIETQGELTNPIEELAPLKDRFYNGEWVLENNDLKIQQTKQRIGWSIENLYRFRIVIQSPKHYPYVQIWIDRIYSLNTIPSLSRDEEVTVALVSDYKAPNSVVTDTMIKTALNLLLLDGVRWLKDYTNIILMKKPTRFVFNGLTSNNDRDKETDKYKETNKYVEKEWKKWVTQMKKGLIKK